MKLVFTSRLVAAFLSLLAVACSIPSTGCDSKPMKRVLGVGDTMKLSVKGKTLIAELAIDDASRGRGLMFRKSLAEDSGMLFIWPRATLQKFWMRNTPIPLSIAYIDDDGRILQIEDMQPQDERLIPSKDEVRFALEMTQGWFSNNGVKAGDVFDEFAKRVRGIASR